MASDTSKRGQNGRVHGILAIDKPVGITSMDVVRRMKRASRHRRVGHGGTLDPIAGGVVPVCFGQATRVMEYLVDSTKDYRASVELGAETDTYDALGEVTARHDAAQITLEQVEASLQSFKGTIQQVPPMYSALKRKGKRLYDLARAGVQVELEPRQVEVLSLQVVDWSAPVVTLEVRCGRGFYVRSLAYDLGRALGCGGHLKALVRNRTGPFKVSDALSLNEAERRIEDGSWLQELHSPDVVVGHLRAAIVGRRVEQMLRHGRSLPTGLRIPFSKPDERCRVYGVDGRFIGIMSFDASAGQWQPDRVFNL